MPKLEEREQSATMDRHSEKAGIDGSAAGRKRQPGCVVLGRPVSGSARARRAARSRRAALGVVTRYVRAASGGRKAATADVQGLRLWRSPSNETTARISVEGEIDLATVGKLRDAIAGALAERPERLVFDLERVTFADSQLAHVLEDACRLMGEGPSGVVVVGASRGVMRLLGICELDHLCTA
jgi:anti-anti-sigma factor